MLTLQAFNQLPFVQYPQLLTIWPEPSNTNMQTGYRLDIEDMKVRPELDFGLMYLIKKDNEVIGVTGLFIIYDDEEDRPYNPELETAYLRWHGVIPACRGQGYAQEALRLMLVNAKEKYPKLQTLIELIPQAPYAMYLNEHFSKQGFVSVGMREKYDWSEYEWQPYHLDVEKYLNNK
jgi:hypothetical protein